MPLPRGSEYKVPLLLELEGAGGTARHQDIYDKICAHFPPVFFSPSDRDEENKSGSVKYEKDIQGEAERLKRDGLITRTSGGFWPITPRGKKAWCGSWRRQPVYLHQSEAVPERQVVAAITGTPNKSTEKMKGAPGYT